MEQSKKDKVELSYVGMAGLDNEVPIYIDQNEKYWGKLNLHEEGCLELHKYELSMDDSDNIKEILSAQPKIEESYPDMEIKIVSDFERNETLKFNYMMLGRLKSDCEYYLGFGGRSKTRLWAGDEPEQINEMKKLYNSFPDEKKPQWISMDDIEKYELQMCNNENEELEQDDYEEEYISSVGMSM